jgi:hypothetical protein
LSAVCCNAAFDGTRPKSILCKSRGQETKYQIYQSKKEKKKKIEHNGQGLRAHRFAYAEKCCRSAISLAEALSCRVRKLLPTYQVLGRGLTKSADFKCTTNKCVHLK